MVWLLGAVLLASPAHSTVMPTNEYIFVYDGEAKTAFLGDSLAVDSVVDAYDPSGVHCGTVRTSTQGAYQAMTVYRDGADTPEVDEGAIPGDKLSFRINGIPAQVAAVGGDEGVTEAFWTQDRDIISVRLQVPEGAAGLVPNSLELGDGVSATLIPYFIPEDGSAMAVSAPHDSVRFFSSDETIATVNDWGVVTAMTADPGSATITLTLGGGLTAQTTIETGPQPGG